MSKRRRNKVVMEKKVVQPTIVKKAPQNDEELQKELAVVQGLHLRFLEQWAASLPKFYGVPVVQGLNYELIQILNDVRLREVAPAEAKQ